MSTISKIFVVIDPTTDQQIALERAARMTARNKALSLHVYCAVFNTLATSDEQALQRAEIARHRVWIESLLESVGARAESVEIEVEWTTQWRDALAPAAQRCAADLIVKAASAHWVAGRRLLKTADWTLLRQAHCPVYLTKGQPIEKGAKFLLALDLKKEDDLHSTLNERVIAMGQSLAKNVEDATLYAVNAYSSSERFVYPSDLAEKVGIPDKQAYTIEGPPARVIAEVASDIEADMVIIGTVGRDGAKGAVLGNTAELVLDSVAANVLVVTAH